jgi:hypothetical protein
MKLIDIDQIQELDTHIHYIKSYKGSVILMDRHSKMFRFNVNFSFEHRPMGDPIIKINFLEHPHFPVIGLIKEVRAKLLEKNRNGIIFSLKNNKKKI